MIDKFPIITLGSIAANNEGAIAIGPFGSAMKADTYVLHGVPVIRGTNIASGRMLAGDWVFVSDDFADSMPRCVVLAGDLVFPHRGSIGEVALVPADRDRYFLSTSCMKVTLDEKIADPVFVFYYFKSPSGRNEILRFASQVGTPGIGQPLTSLKQFRLPCPPIKEQRAIAHILGTLDDRIEANRRMAAMLEEMARALFRAWFVSFEPVRAKAEGRWQPGQIRPGLPAALYDLFPDRLVETERGEVPEGWTLEPLSNHLEATKGISYQGDGLGDQGVPLHNLNSIYEGGGYKYEGIKYYAGDYRPRHVVRPGDVIVANTEQGHDRLLIGYAAIVPKIFGKFGVASHHIYRVTIKPGSPFRPSFLCAMLNSRRMHDVVSGYANGTTVNMLPEDGLQMPLATVPPPGLIEAFDALARNSEQRREEMVAESRTLVAVRDALLPKLISGELRIPDPETFLDRVRA